MHRPNTDRAKEENMQNTFLVGSLKISKAASYRMM